MRQEDQRGQKTRWTQRGQRRTGRRLFPLFIPPTELHLGIGSCSLMPMHLLVKLKVFLDRELLERWKPRLTAVCEKLGWKTEW